MVISVKAAREVERNAMDSRHIVSVSLLTDFQSCRVLAKNRIDGLIPKAPSMALTFGTVVHDMLAAVHLDVASGRLTKIPKEQYIKDLAAKVRQRQLTSNVSSVQFIQILE